MPYRKLIRAYRAFSNPRFRARMAKRKYGLYVGGRYVVPKTLKQPMRKQTKSRFKSRMRRQVGLPRGYSSAMTSIQQTANPAPSSSRQFNLMYDLTDIQGQSAADPTNPAKRQSNRVWVSGFKIEYYVNTFRDQTTNDPLHFHFAVVSSKNGQIPSQGNFLRGHGEEEGIDLDTGRTGLQMCNCSINTDQYSVLLHHKVQLKEIGNNSTVGLIGIKPYAKRHVWVPLKRQITYDSMTSNSNSRVYIVHWADFPTSNAGSAAISQMYTLRVRAITYFRNMIR